MFSFKEKKDLATQIEKLLLALNHPEMPSKNPEFKLHVKGKESWSWADIEPNWKFENEPAKLNKWNELSRDIMEKKEEKL